MRPTFCLCLARFETSKQHWRLIMIKSFMPAMLVASALAIPTLAFAQDSQGQGLTRAEVRAELIQVERAGYNPSADDVYYPANIQAAEARVAAANGGNGTSYGPSTEGTSASGLHAYGSPDIVSTRSLYSRH
jgi:Domain of unknown function (DUF4148)